VLIMAAWNYPFALVFAPLAAAVAAGNCVMVRASEKVPQTSIVARRVIDETFDPDEVAMIGGDRSTAEHLLDLPFDHVFFTGSTMVGRAIMTATARHLSGVTLELGGKSPVVIDASADVPAAARSVAWGKFVNAGQTCVAPDYVLIHASRAQEFFDASRDALAAFYGASDDARRTSDDYCRMIDDAGWARVTKLLDEAVRAGARIEVGGQTDAGQRYIAPTILSNVSPASPVMAEEIFGPILPVLTYQSRDEVFAFLRGRPKPLAMYVFCTDEQRTNEILGGTAAGGTVINNCLIHLMNPALPFGGVGESGFGNYHGRFGFETFSHARAVLVQGRPNLTRFFHPPYARLRSGWLGALLRTGRRLRD
jgi:aldehyde dehydrogenase (NAD+)